MENRTERNSSIELLRVLGIALIVVGHVVQTLGSGGNAYFPYSDFAVDLREATNNIQFLLLAMLRHCGDLGSTLFFVCSAWFFLDNNRVSKKKMFLMLTDLWAVSLLILAAVLLVEHGAVKKSLILMSLMPLTFQNYWYISCYLIFYAIHPLLNTAIEKCGRKALFRLNAAALLLYFVIAFVTCLTQYLYSEGTSFFMSKLILWTVIYFLLAYMKKYADEPMKNKSLNIAFIIVGFLGYFGLVGVMNLLGLRRELFRNSLQIWQELNNPFLLLLVLGLFNLARSREYRRNWINELAKLSLFIYVFHENRLLRTLYRPAMWQFVYDRFGYDRILLWTLLLSVIVFAFGLVCSVVYVKTFRKITVSVSDRLYSLLSGAWRSFENRVL